MKKEAGRKAEASPASAMAADKSGLPVLVLLPKNREQILATAALTRANIRTEICEQLDRLEQQIGDHTGVAEEALAVAQISPFLKRLRAQPQWSDLPLLVLTSGSEADDPHHRILDLLGPNANVTFVARPFRGLTLVSAVQAALRARRHQFAVRDLIAERETFVLAELAGMAEGKNDRPRHLGNFSGSGRHRIL